jgi:hypothetical protein
MLAEKQKTLTAENFIIATGSSGVACHAAH